MVEFRLEALSLPTPPEDDMRQFMQAMQRDIKAASSAFWDWADRTNDRIVALRPEQFEVLELTATMMSIGYLITALIGAGIAALMSVTVLCASALAIAATVMHHQTTVDRLEQQIAVQQIQLNSIASAHQDLRAHVGPEKASFSDQTVWEGIDYARNVQWIHVQEHIREDHGRQHSHQIGLPVALGAYEQFPETALYILERYLRFAPDADDDRIPDVLDLCPDSPHLRSRPSEHFSATGCDAYQVALSCKRAAKGAEEGRIRWRDCELADNLADAVDCLVDTSVPEGYSDCYLYDPRPGMEP